MPGTTPDLHFRNVIRTILIYGVLLAAGAFGLRWMEYQFVIRTHATETYLVLIALAFLGLGIWAGARLFRRPPPNARRQARRGSGRGDAAHVPGNGGSAHGGVHRHQGIS